MAVGRFMAIANRAPYRLAIEALQPVQGERLLEVGFGPGEGIASLVRQVPGARLCGIDGSPAMVRLAGRRNRAAVAQGCVTLLEGDFRCLPWASESFDGVLAVNVAYFFDAEGRMIREIARTLRPGGRLVLYVTDRETMRHWPFAGPDTHVTFGAQDLESLLRAGGFPPAAIAVRKVRLPLAVQGLIAVAHRPGA